MKARGLVAILLTTLILLCVFAGCDSTKPQKGVNLDGPEKGMYIGDSKGGSSGLNLVGSAGIKVESYSGYIGHGYDVINSPYYAPDYIKKGCVLDTDKLAKAGFIYEDKQNQFKYEQKCGETLSSFSQQFNASVGAEVKGLFSGSLSADFGLSDSVSEKTSFAKGMIYVTTMNQYIDTMKISFEDIRDKYLTDVFKNILMDSKNWTPERLFREYGTHIMLSVYLGGRLDMNFVYNNVNNESQKTIESMVNASYAAVSGSASASDKQLHKSFVSNSSFKLISYGGTVGLDMQTFEKAQQNLSAWLTSIEKDNMTAFIKAGNVNTDSEMYPIWKFIDKDSSKEAADRYNEIEGAYLDMLEEAGKTVDGKQVKTEPTYIKDIYMGAGPTWGAAVSDLTNKSMEEMHILYQDLNAQAEGDYLVLGYTVTKNPDEALRNIIFRTEQSAPHNWNGWSDANQKEVQYTYRPYDCNQGAGGEYIWMYYTHDAWAGDPITDLFVEVNFNTSGKNGKTNWKRATCYNLGGDMELNLGAGGAYIYLWLRY